MKKITILFPALFMGIAMFGQTGMIGGQTTGNNGNVAKHFSANTINPTHKSKFVAGEQSPVATKVTTKGKSVTAAPFWTDDFSTPANWRLNDHLGPDAWTIGTAGPAGAYWISTILSTTAANGFGLFDSDNLCSGNQDAKLTIVNPIVCTGHPYIVLSFQQQYRRWYDSTYVEVSSDSTTWAQYGVNVPLGNGDYCPGNPNTANVDISPSAGNQAKVWIRFRFYSPSSLGGSAGCGYSWMVDDVALTDQAANDLAFSQAAVGGDKAIVNFGDWWQGYYTMSPKAQTALLTFTGYASNLGFADQHAAVLTVDVNNGSGSVFTAASVAQDLVVRSNDSLLVAWDGTSATEYTPPVNIIANYTATFTLSQTETELATEIGNNTSVKAFAITDTVFAHDDGTSNTRLSPNFYTGAETDGVMAASYYFSANDEASSVSVYIADRTQNAATITAEIYELDTVTGSTPVLIALSDPYDVDSLNDVNKWKTLSVKTPGTPIVLHGNYTYYAAIHATGVDANATPATYVAIGGDQSTYQPDAVNWVFVSPDWGWISGGQPMIRLNTVSQTIGVNEIAKNSGASISQNMPNPTNGISVINYELEKNAKVALSVFDITGKKVATQNIGEQNAGKHSINFNSANLAAGVYTYSLTVGNNTTSTMKMVVIK
ncbi:MAG: hypothetical protein A3F72_00660 [Bacteroidetes bacterium RIFCSPLOWO2_12_FULL_35_15]|nr:MAG: hypothetical protein A3F72_00660 [Bacteroidetes bacterium RIFCSPLOWO2_12_FULL_35_15]